MREAEHHPGREERPGPDAEGREELAGGAQEHRREDHGPRLRSVAVNLQILEDEFK